MHLKCEIGFVCLAFKQDEHDIVGVDAFGKGLNRACTTLKKTPVYVLDASCHHIKMGPPTIGFRMITSLNVIIPSQVRDWLHKQEMWKGYSLLRWLGEPFHDFLNKKQQTFLI